VATALGLTDGHIWRVQGGARIGTDYEWNGVHVTQKLTGLAYSDVEVTGGAIQSGGSLDQQVSLLIRGKSVAKVFGQLSLIT